MNESKQFTVRLKDGSEFGPAGMEDICQWAREGRVPSDAMLVSPGEAPPMPVLSVPALAPLCVPAAPAPPGAASEGGDEVIASIVPYRNPAALIGYYISIVSLFPILGLIAGPVAIWQGVVGLRKRREDPRIKGMAHAWIAIILGSIGTAISLTCASAIAYGLANRGL